RDLWLLCWMIVPVVALTLVRQKVFVYLLPSMTPVALILGRYWSSLSERSDGADQLRTPLNVLGGLGMTGSIVLLAGAVVMSTDAAQSLKRDWGGIINSLAT